MRFSADYINVPSQHINVVMKFNANVLVTNSQSNWCSKDLDPSSRQDFWTLRWDLIRSSRTDLVATGSSISSQHMPMPMVKHMVSRHVALTFNFNKALRIRSRFSTWKHLKVTASRWKRYPLPVPTHSYLRSRSAGQRHLGQAQALWTFWDQPTPCLLQGTRKLLIKILSYNTLSNIEYIP